jgi:hypothetical protein
MNENRTSVKHVEAHSALCLPTDAAYASFGRLSWVSARLESLASHSCAVHGAHVDCYELSGSRALVEELLAVGTANRLTENVRGYRGIGMRVPVGDDFVSLIMHLDGRSSRLKQPDIYHLWPHVKGCPASCPNVPERGIFSLAPDHGPHDVALAELELRWTLQVNDGMDADKAKEAARLLSR